MRDDEIQALSSEERQERLLANRASDRAKRESQLNHHYRIELSGGEADIVRQAMMLNRRMLDRGLEHQVLDRALTLVVGKLQEDWLSTEEGLSLTNTGRAVWGLPPLQKDGLDPE